MFTISTGWPDIFHQLNHAEVNNGWTSYLTKTDWKPSPVIPSPVISEDLPDPSDPFGFLLFFGDGKKIVKFQRGGAGMPLEKGMPSTQYSWLSCFCWYKYKVCTVYTPWQGFRDARAVKSWSLCVTPTNIDFSETKTPGSVHHSSQTSFFLTTS